MSCCAVHGASGSVRQQRENRPPRITDNEVSLSCHSQVEKRRMGPWKVHATVRKTVRSNLLLLCKAL